MTTFFKWFALLILLSLFPLLDLLHPGLFDAHDSPDHVARIANFYQNLAEGTIIPRWAGNLNWGYGHPILMFLYPLPSYAASLFHFLGFSLVDATKLVFAVAYIFSGITMYIWMRAAVNEAAGFTAGILYLFAPYRFVDLYVRGAIGEHVFFIWPPLVCYFLMRYFRTHSPTFGVAISVSLALMILSHNALSIMFMPFIGIYALWLLFRSYKKNKPFKTLNTAAGSGAAFVLGLGLSAFFWAPAYFEGKYTLRDIVTKNVLFDRFEPFSRLVYSPWSFGGTGEMSVQVGPVHWLIMLISIVMLIFTIKYQRVNTRPIRQLTEMADKVKNTDQLLKISPPDSIPVLITCLLFFVLSIFLVIEQSAPIYHVITLFQKFQFPWRWLSLSVFVTSVSGGIVIFLMPQKIRIPMAILIAATAVLYTIPFWGAKGYIRHPESYYAGVYKGTTDTGESSPYWSVRFMEREPEARMEVIDGEAEITENDRRIRRHSYTVNVLTDSARILENTLYFPGWSVYIDGKKLPESDLQFQNPNHRGLITFLVPAGRHDVTLMFKETKLRLVSNVISVVSLLAIMGIIGYGKITVFFHRA